VQISAGREWRPGESGERKMTSATYSTPTNCSRITAARAPLETGTMSPNPVVESVVML
jgi:hypothetical protein